MHNDKVKDAQKPDHISLNTLIGRLKEGRYVIPDFQRDFEWMPWDIQDLMRSIFLDYFIGSLLLWKGKSENFNALACEPLYGATTDGSPEHIVLDGQQRLTAMYYAFVAPNVPAPNRANRYLYFIRVDRFMDEADDEAFVYDWTQGAVKLTKNRAEQFERHMFPLSVVGESGWALADWVREYEGHWRDKAKDLEASGNDAGALGAARHADQAQSFGQNLKDITEQYQIAYIELDRDLALDKVCDIFTQINSKGVRLDIFDLINALIRPKGLPLKQMWRDAAPRLDFIESDRMNVYCLQVMSILVQAYCSPKYLYYLMPGQQKAVREPGGALHKEVLVPDVKNFSDRWLASVAALEKAIDLLRHPHEYGAISSRYFPYVSILPAFAALQEQSRALPANERLGAQRKIRHWYWASVFTNRYSGSVESTSARDFLDVKAWFDDDDSPPALLGEFRDRFRSLDLRKETRPGSSVYNGIFNLLVLRGARDWMTGLVPQYGDLDDHHIVPKAWGKGQTLSTSIDTILNRTPLTADTNRNVISDRLPNAYLPELIKKNGESTVRSILESHFISAQAFDVLMRDPFSPSDFDAFLVERQRTLQEAIEDLLIKERLDLAPQLRELDVRVEKVEIGLRAAVHHVLGDDPAMLPPHVLVKLDERVKARARRDPAVDPARYNTLQAKLAFADLRELQDTITGKTHWSSFEPRFVNKEVALGKFDQLAELRNGIRHSRTVDEITRKEGEASLLWFEQVLAK